MTLTKKECVSIKEYAHVLQDIKQQIRETQVRAVLSANKELIKLYWYTGKTITEQQKIHGWGSNSVEKLAKNIQKEFPGLGGFSRRNIFRIQTFFIAYEKVPECMALTYELPVFHIPWGDNALLIEKIKNNEERLWYTQKAIENGWSRIII